MGASIYNKGDYVTPLGKVPVNIQLANELIKSNPVSAMFTMPISASIALKLRFLPSIPHEETLQDRPSYRQPERSDLQTDRPGSETDFNEITVCGQFRLSHYPPYTMQNPPIKRPAMHHQNNPDA